MHVVERSGRALRAAGRVPAVRGRGAAKEGGRATPAPSAGCADDRAAHTDRTGSRPASLESADRQGTTLLEVNLRPVVSLAELCADTHQLAP